MLIYRIGLRRLHNAGARGFFSKFLQRCRKEPTRCIRWQGTTTKPKPQPQSLEAKSTGRTVFIGCTKVSTLFVFGFFCVVVAPAYFNAPDEPQWMVPAGKDLRQFFHGCLLCLLVIAAGAIPMLYVAWSTKPFTSYVHLVLPERARLSREALTQWLNASGRNVQLDFTTMRFNGLSRVTRTRVTDLKRRREGATDISNIVYGTAASSRRAKVRSIFGAPRRFHVSDRVNHSKEPKLWKAMYQRIPEGSSK